MNSKKYYQKAIEKIKKAIKILSKQSHNTPSTGVPKPPTPLLN